MLTRIVRQATGRSALTLHTWYAQPLLHHARQVTAGIYRFRGTATVGTEALPWSVVLKIIQPTSRRLQSDACFYWKREALVFRSGLLDALEGALVAVRCFEVAQQPDGTFWLWLEDVDADEVVWDLPRHCLAAKHFGAFNGAYLSGKPLPAYPWLSRAFLRSWLAEYRAFGAVDALRDPAVWTHPLIAQAFPPSLVQRLLRLVEHHTPLVQALERQPQTLSHLDAHRPNLFSRRQGTLEQTVVIDWASLGMAALGEELGMQVFGNLFILEVAPSEAPAYGQAALEAYLEGLYAVGWRGDETSVRIAFGLSGALRYAVFLPLQVQGLAKGRGLPPWGASWAQARGFTSDVTLLRWGEVCRYMLNLADEACMLLARKS